jgi:hypothetical protein
MFVESLLHPCTARPRAAFVALVSPVLSVAKDVACRARACPTIMQPVLITLPLAMTLRNVGENLSLFKNRLPRISGGYARLLRLSRGYQVLHHDGLWAIYRYRTSGFRVRTAAA